MNLLESALRAVLDDPLADVRAAAPGGCALGCVGYDVPLDLLLATDRPFAHLPWQADRATPFGDRWLESGFPGWARSMLQDWSDGAFDVFSQVLFTRSDDATQRLYYYVCELQRRGLLRGPAPLMLDVARIARPASLHRTTQALRGVGEQLGVSTQDLAQGVLHANALREHYAALDADRRGPGSLYAQLAQASHFTDLQSLPGLDALATASPVGGRRVLLAGSAPPDDRLHREVEAAGATVVADHHGRSLRRHGPVVACAGDPFDALAAQLHGRPEGPRGFGNAAALLGDAVAAARADAVVLWLTREDESLVWHVPAQRRAMADAGVPLLVLGARRWDGNDGAATEIHAFLESLA
jgi:hypothetical protein